MTLQLLKINIEREEQIIKELDMFANQLFKFDISSKQKSEYRLLEEATDSLLKQLEIINNAIPDILKNIKFYKPFDSTEQKNEKERKSEKLLKVSYEPSDKKDKSGKIEFGIKREDKLNFLETETKKRELEKKMKDEKELIKINTATKISEQYVRLSNKVFRNFSENLVEKKYFNPINRDLRKVVSQFVLSSYLSIMFFSTLLAFIAGVFLSVILIFFNVSISVIILLFFGIPLTVFLLIYSYPSSQRRMLEREINQELPFVTVYMAAVATSGIEPSKIFSILIKTKDYPFTQREIMRLLNYINFYGYDLVSALKQSSRLCPSERLGLLFNGLATSITSGGDLSQFLEKHSDSLLFDYRLEREKYTKIAETFMDIYISILIAAPMIMMILFILLSLTGYGSSFMTPNVLSFAIVGVVTMLNIGFLIFLNIKQPKF